jgi:signal transduction histidine kinase
MDDIVLIVKDRGAGFNPDQATSPAEGGFGLVQIRQRVTALGGQFNIKSKPGRGTRVCLIIPCGVPLVAAGVDSQERPSYAM